MKTRILVVDEQDIVRRGVVALLQPVLPDAEFQASGVRLTAKASRHRWDLVILGIAGADGLQLIPQLKSSGAGKVLALSVYPEREMGVRTLEAGADGYLERDAAVEELIRATRHLLSGRRYVSRGLAELLAEAVAHPRESGLGSLSNRELYVLRRIGQGLKLRDIAGEMGLSIKTVSTYRSRVLDKLRLETTADLVRFALQNKLAG